jgi:hypothetical protein
MTTENTARLAEQITTRAGNVLNVGLDGQLWIWTDRGQVTVAGSAAAPAYLLDKCDDTPRRAVLVRQLSHGTAYWTHLAAEGRKLRMARLHARTP